jgi:hypothetical protein
MTADHVVPLPIGCDDITNIQPLCDKCNLAKGNTYADYRDGRLGERHYCPTCGKGFGTPQARGAHYRHRPDHMKPIENVSEPSANGYR